MNRRTALQQLAVLALAASPAGFALAAGPREGTYRTLSAPVPTEVKGKVEVLEFFSYGCPHCRDLDPLLEKWEKNLPTDVSFVRVPITFGREQWARYARIYYTLEALGETGKHHAAVFAALHDSRIPLHDESALFSWVEKRGLDKAKFTEAWKSFGVQSRVQRSNQLSTAYRVDAVPLMAVNGLYLVSASGSGGFEEMLQTVDQLIVKSRG